MNFALYSHFNKLLFLKGRLCNLGVQQRTGSHSKSWQPRLRHLTAVLAAGTVLGWIPAAKAFEVFFNAPNVLGGIRNVPVTLPSTGVTARYNVLLKKGTFEEIYGSPALTDVDNVVDAQALMEMSANAINNYISSTSSYFLSFAEPRADIYYLPYGSAVLNPGGVEVAPVSASGFQCNPWWPNTPPPGVVVPGAWVPLPPPPINNGYCQYIGTPPPEINPSARYIIPSLGEIPTTQSVVWADLQPVPGPLPLAGGLVAWRWARMLRQRRKQDRC
jgi:hypothetical protein